MAGKQVNQDNPWHRLPESTPFVLPDDRAAVVNFNAKRADSEHFLHIETILPEPFVGARDAPVVLLSNNPGYGQRAHYREKPVFMEAMRKNLHHVPSNYPFVYLDLKFSEAGKWWAIKLKDLVTRFGHPTVANSILNVAFFPYPSRTYSTNVPRLPSQDYSFRLVREAMERNAVIVLMRKRAPWSAEVDGLSGYGRLYRVKNWQNPAISRGNCDHFDDIVRAIESAATQR